MYLVEQHGYQCPVICSPDELIGEEGGMPVFKGTRVVVKNLFDYLSSGYSLDVFLDDFPSVSREQAVRALEMAKEAIEGYAYEHIGESQQQSLL